MILLSKVSFDRLIPYSKTTGSFYIVLIRLARGTKMLKTPSTLQKCHCSANANNCRRASLMQTLVCVHSTANCRMPRLTRKHLNSSKQSSYQMPESATRPQGNRLVFFCGLRNSYACTHQQYLRALQNMTLHGAVLLTFSCP